MSTNPMSDYASMTNDEFIRVVDNELDNEALFETVFEGSLCPVCNEPMPAGVDCHHHNTYEEATDDGRTLVVCEDCPAYWPLDEVPC